MKVITRTFDDYANVIKAHEIDIKAGMKLRRIAKKYGLAYCYFHKVYQELCRTGELDLPYQRKSTSKKVAAIEELLINYSRKELKYIDIARQVGVSREYVRQIKNILIGEGKLAPDKKNLFQ